jgi:hypothetical protein
MLGSETALQLALIEELNSSDVEKLFGAAVLPKNSSPLITSCAAERFRKSGKDSTTWFVQLLEQRFPESLNCGRESTARALILSMAC